MLLIRSINRTRFPFHAAPPLPPLLRQSIYQLRHNTLISHSVLSRMPANAWDSHIHPTHPPYTPSLHTIQHALSFSHSLSIRNIVLVQPSIYATDNACLLDALRAVGPERGRGVVAIDPGNVQKKTLDEWHGLGVRGVRLNLKSSDTSLEKEELGDMLRRYGDIVRPRGWVLELFIGMEDLLVLEEVLKGLDVKMCIAHFGAPTLPAINHGRDQAINTSTAIPGFSSLLRLLQSPSSDSRHPLIYVKFSAAYRFDSDPDMRGIEPLAKELLKAAPDRMVFASDWPHTRFKGMDVRPFVSRCLEWCEEMGEDVKERVFVKNAKELWDVKE